MAACLVAAWGCGGRKREDSPEGAKVLSKTGSAALEREIGGGRPVGDVGRWLDFPEGDSLGWVSLRESGAEGLWVSWGEARGRVGIPRDREVMLAVSTPEAEGLGDLQPDDVQVLYLPSYAAHGANLARIAGWTGLRELTLENPFLGDSALRHLAGLSSLRKLSFSAWQGAVFVPFPSRVAVTDAGLVHLRGLARMRALDLGGAEVADAGMAELADLKELEWLNLSFTHVGDAGLERLAGLVNLKSLWLQGTDVSDGGLKHLERMTALERLDLDQTRVTDAGVASLGRLPALRSLYLNRTAVSEAALGPLAALPALERVELDFTRVGDGAIETLAAMPALRHLSIYSTRVTYGGLARLKRALPRCRVLHDGLKPPPAGPPPEPLS